MDSSTAIHIQELSSALFKFVCYATKTTHNNLKMMVVCKFSVLGVPKCFCAIGGKQAYRLLLSPIHRYL